MEKPESTNKSQNPPRDPILETFYILRQVVIVAVILATIYTAWSPSTLFSNNFNDQLPSINFQKPIKPNPKMTFTPLPRRVGIVSGHWGNDSGAVCPDGLKEADVNLTIATLVQKKLAERGIQTDLLKEKDKRLAGYYASALVSIHNDSCNYVNDVATGFKVAAALANEQPEKSARLTTCLNDRYAKDTGLSRHVMSITKDMTSYHAFDEISPETPAAIIETGFLNLDRQILTQKPDIVAQGIADGVLCFLNYESIEPTAVATHAVQGIPKP
jgi:N-acetylmuramoyl-L-alanine amidase